MVMQDVVFCAVQYCGAPIKKMLLYKSEEIAFTFITENLKGQKEKRIFFPTHADFTVILNGTLMLKNS